MTLAAMFGLSAANEAITSANLTQVDPRRVGVAIGTGMVDMPAIEAALGSFEAKKYRGVSPHFVPLILPNMIAGHVSIRYGFRGPNHCVCTACAAGAHSVGDAFRYCYQSLIFFS
jgi:3-oxoacyl-[acyl-carrier-protein] synthase II